MATMLLTWRDNTFALALSRIRYLKVFLSLFVLSKDGATNLVLLSGKTPRAGSVPHKSVILSSTTTDHGDNMTNLPASKSKKSYYYQGNSSISVFLFHFWIHWSFRPAGGPSLSASFVSVILSLLGKDVFVLSSLYHLGRALLRVREIDYTVMVWWLWYDIDDDSFIERLRCRAIECQRRHWFDVHRSGPWPYYSRSLYTRVLQTKTKSFNSALQVRLDEDDLFRHCLP
jgi:hypothetical protein